MSKVLVTDSAVVNYEEGANIDTYVAGRVKVEGDDIIVTLDKWLVNSLGYCPDALRGEEVYASVTMTREQVVAFANLLLSMAGE